MLEFQKEIPKIDDHSISLWTISYISCILLTHSSISWPFGIFFHFWDHGSLAGNHSNAIASRDLLSVFASWPETGGWALRLVFGFLFFGEELIFGPVSGSLLTYWLLQALFPWDNFTAPGNSYNDMLRRCDHEVVSLEESLIRFHHSWPMPQSSVQSCAMAGSPQTSLLMRGDPEEGFEFLVKHKIRIIIQ